MPTKPTKKPEWASSDVVDVTSGQNNVVEPSASKKTRGWDREEIPPRQWWNWLLRIIYAWIDWLDGTTIPLSSDVGTSNEQLSDGTGHTHAINGASQIQAESGSDNTVVMTPLRTKEAINSLAVGYSLMDSEAAFSITDLSSFVTGDTRGLAFSADNTKIFVMDENGIVYSCTMTPNEPDSITYDSISLDVSVQVAVPNGGMRITPDGTKLQIMHSSDIHQWTMSTALDLSTASYDGFKALDPGADDFVFNSDGTIITTIGSAVPQTTKYYSLSTAYDVTSAGTSTAGLNISSEVGSPQSIELQIIDSSRYRFFISDSLSPEYYHSYTTSLDFITSSANYFGVSGAFTTIFTERFSLHGIFLAGPLGNSTNLVFRSTNYTRRLI